MIRIGIAWLMVGLSVCAADPMLPADEQAAWDAIAARFTDSPTTSHVPGKGITIKVTGLKSRSDGKGMASILIDSTGHVVNVTTDGAYFTNDEFKLFARFPDLASLTLWHNFNPDKKAKTSLDSGEGLAHLLTLKKLSKVTLAGGGLNDAGLAVAATLPHLAELHIWHARFTDAGIAALKNHPSLEVIKVGPMWANDITDASLAALATCPKLRHIQIAETYLSWDNGLSHISKLPNLAILDLKNCLIEPADVDRVKAALPKCKVEWAGLAEAGKTLAGSGFFRGRAEKWMPKDLLAKAAIAAAASK
jgi:hypothetical protein